MKASLVNETLVEIARLKMQKPGPLARPELKPKAEGDTQTDSAKKTQAEAPAMERIWRAVIGVARVGLTAPLLAIGGA